MPFSALRSNLVLIGPFLVPVPPLEGTVPPKQWADPDSHFVEVNGIQVLVVS
jgi:hypothetical protein